MNALLLVALISCVPKPAVVLPDEAVDLPDPTPETTSPDPEFFSSHMSTHYTLLTSARDALIRGDLEGIKEPMGWLANHEIHETIPQPYVPYIHQMRGAARVALESRSVEGASNAVATVATICGECHEDMGVGPSFGDETALPDREGVGWHMARHRWAADRMWEGMIGPSDTSWNIGVTALQEDPLKAEELHAGMDMSEDEAAVAEWLHKMGDFGVHMQGSMPRSSFYGEFLAQCSSCHNTIREPAPEPAPAE